RPGGGRTSGRPDRRADLKEGRMASSDESAIESVVLDYFEGWFEGDAARMQRALHPELAKRSPGADGALQSDSAEEMIEATAQGVGKTRLPEDGDPRIVVEVVEVYDTIASAIVRSAVYWEYPHLVRTPTGWKIANALWQRTLR